MAEVKLNSTITCPACGYRKEEEMPTDACQFFYQCDKCDNVLKPKQGDCCVFCSYGDMPYPPIQEDKSCCSK
ncbi:GDCCVxC domain-containing (seleno)protein [Pontibacter sp. MBLB2868]|uniref:GDCCVxC domain-containing (seleno)protein n=1 Tax=Pontibacter sp. MBLB2868 TaxID=3451555 RepID=UPI003F74C1D3